MNDPRLSNQDPRRPNRCRLVRTGLFGGTTHGLWAGIRSRAGIDLNADWVQRHIAGCPRCQRRFAALARVQLGLALLKSQAHGLDLLKHANARAIGVLSHGLRDQPKALELQTRLPGPTILDRIRLYRHSLAQTAACIAILVLSRIGVFSSMEYTQRQGHKTVKDYLDRNLGKDLADDLFSET